MIQLLNLIYLITYMLKIFNLGIILFTMSIKLISIQNDFLWEGEIIFLWNLICVLDFDIFQFVVIQSKWAPFFAPPFIKNE